MANPVFVECTQDAWTKVATNVVAGNIHKWDLTPRGYLQTYKLTGEAAPTLITDGVPAFENSISEPISSSDSIDVYIWADGATGKVRVDL